MRRLDSVDRGIVTWCQEWDPVNRDVERMEKYLAPEPIGEGELSDLWRRFKREFTLFLTAISKDEPTEQTKLAYFPAHSWSESK